MSYLRTRRRRRLTALPESNVYDAEGNCTAARLSANHVEGRQAISSFLLR
jgi:hypothetical protein